MSRWHMQHAWEVSMKHDLTHVERCVMMAIANHVNATTNQWRMGIHIIAKEAGVNPSYCKRVITSLLSEPGRQPARWRSLALGMIATEVIGHVRHDVRQDHVFASVALVRCADSAAGDDAAIGWADDDLAVVGLGESHNPTVVNPVANVNQVSVALGEDGNQK